MPLVVPPMVLQSPPAGEGKRRHLKSRRMIEYEKEKDRAAPQKQRMCPHPGCKKLFSSAPGLRYHVKTHSPDAANFRCDRCRREFKRCAQGFLGTMNCKRSWTEEPVPKLTFLPHPQPLSHTFQLVWFVTIKLYFLTFQVLFHWFCFYTSRWIF